MTLILSNFMKSFVFSCFAAELPSRFSVYSEDIYPLELSEANVTCSAFDPAGVKVPEKIKFFRTVGNERRELAADENFYYTNRTEIHCRLMTSK